MLRRLPQLLAPLLLCRLAVLALAAAQAGQQHGHTLAVRTGPRRAATSQAGATIRSLHGAARSQRYQGCETAGCESAVQSPPAGPPFARPWRARRSVVALFNVDEAHQLAAADRVLHPRLRLRMDSEPFSAESWRRLQARAWGGSARQTVAPPLHRYMHISSLALTAHARSLPSWDADKTSRGVGGRPAHRLEGIANVELAVGPLRHLGYIAGLVLSHTYQGRERSGAYAMRASSRVQR